MAAKKKAVVVTATKKGKAGKGAAMAKGKKEKC